MTFRRINGGAVVACLAVLTLPLPASADPVSTKTSITLPPLVVEGDAINVKGYRALTAKSATKTDTPIERIPQNIQVIPRTVIDSQSVITVSEAVENVSNVQPIDSRIIGNVEQNPVKIRGFGADLWTDGFPGNAFVTGDRDGLVNVERIEVLKGPNAILYGGGAGSPVGGTINVVSKMPLNKARYEVGATFGSYAFWNPYIDINQPITAAGTVLFRLTAEYTGNKSHIDVLDAKRYSINPTLTFTNGAGTSLTLQGFVSDHRQQAYPGLPVSGTILGAFQVRREQYVGHPDIAPSYAEIHGVVATLDHRFNETWSTSIKARWSGSELQQNSQIPFLDATGTGGTAIFPPSTFDLNNSEVFDSQRELSISPTVQAKFTAGPSQNTLLFGADYSHVKDKGYHHIDTLGNFCFLFGLGCPPVVVDLQNPTFTVPFAHPVVGVGEGAAFFEFDNTYITKGLYTQVQSSLYERIHLTAGLRLSSIDITYDEYGTGALVRWVTEKTKVLPRAGAVVDVVKGLSVYAGYSEGMKWVPFSQTFAQPQPEYSKQWEAGVKFNVNEMFTGTLAVFEIRRQNVPFRVSATVGALSEQKSRGFEADVMFQPNDNWSVLGSYGYTDAFFVQSTSATVAAGSKLPSVANHAGRLWVNYKFDQSFLRGFSVGAGVYATSGQYVESQNLWRTGGYHTVDAKIGYDTEKLRVALSVKNLTGEKYYTPYTWFGGQVAAGAPRMIYGQIGYKIE